MAKDHRLASLDAARGLIMVLMALDHVRLFISSAQFDPVDLDHTSPGWFITRWVTHLCAPGFFFIAGLGAALMQSGGATREAVARFLLVRGAWLILFEIIVFGLAWSFNPGWFWFGVIAGLGGSMFILACAVFVPRIAVAFVAIAFTLLHNVAWPTGAFSPNLDALLYSSGMTELPVVGQRLVIFPLLPWSALMLLGYATAPLLFDQSGLKLRTLVVSGLGMLAVFVVLRLAETGQPLMGGFDRTGDRAHDLMSFFNAEKYPPSLQYTLVTLGALALILALFDVMERRGALRILRPLLVFGRVPFFFYLLHIFLIHGLVLAVALILKWPTEYLFWSGAAPSLEPPNGYGAGLSGVYLAWLVTLTLLYPACAWFARVKQASTNPWIRFF